MTDAEKFFQFMLDVQGFIASDSYYGQVPSITEYPAVRSMNNTWALQVNKWMTYLTGGTNNTATQIGLATFITFPHTDTESKTLGSITTDLIGEIAVAESLMANTFVAPQGTNVNGFAPAGVGIHCDDYAAGLMTYLQGWIDGSIAQAVRCVGFRKDADIWIPPDLRTGTVGDLRVCGFQIRALTTLNVPQKCYPPSITINAGMATLTSNTPGASFVYSVGSTFPFAQPTMPYSAPFAVTSGQTIKAMATVSGLKNSSLTDAVAP